MARPKQRLVGCVVVGLTGPDSGWLVCGLFPDPNGDWGIPLAVWRLTPSSSHLIAADCGGHG